MSHRAESASLIQQVLAGGGEASPRDGLVRRLDRYWPRGGGLIARLPSPVCFPQSAPELPPRLVSVDLPEWAADLAVHGSLVIPAHCIVNGPGAPWIRVDWLAAAEWFLNGAAEREYESRNGPIHSYSFRLRRWDARMWQRAWANRIALFLRRRASISCGRPEEELFGPRPHAEIILTHDVDAVRKTAAIRVKQSAFRAFTAARQIASGKFRSGLRSSWHAVRFLGRREDYWFFDRITDLEEHFGIRSHFNFFAVPPSLKARTPLLDPGYDVASPRIRGVVRRLHEGGWRVGLHQSWGSWSDAGRMRRELEFLEAAAGTPVMSCRQHWLRFSWFSTWAAQRQAGLHLDATLGFNDRPGFRNGAALPLRPFGPEDSFESIPTILMDSHFYDYEPMSDDRRREQIAAWIGEVRAVGGIAAVLWHQQVMGSDYGWSEGYDDLLRIVADGRGC